MSVEDVDQDDIWDALIALPPEVPTIDRTARQAIGDRLRDRYSADLAAPPPARVLELLEMLADIGVDGSRHEGL